VLRYLSRYTHRVAISNRRLVAADNTSVAFRWKDCRINGPGRWQTMRLHPHEFIRRFLMHVLPRGHPSQRHTPKLKQLFPQIDHQEKSRGNRAQLGDPHARRPNGHVPGSIEQQALVLPVRHTRRQCAIQKARPDLGIGHAVMLPDSKRSSIWTGELEPAIGLKARNAWSVAIARAAGFRMLVMSHDRDRGTPRGATPPTPPGIRVTYPAVRLG
jgi:hypothetical protein